MIKISDKTRVTITIVLCCVAAVAVTFTFLYIFGVFGGASKPPSKPAKVYALIKEYSFDDAITGTEADFLFEAAVDDGQKTVTVTIRYSSDDKVVSVEAFCDKRPGYATEVSRGDKTLTLKSVTYGDKTVTAVYDAGDAEGRVTIKNFIVTERR
ncbi:MAG: hypothetical protein ILP02_02545 [Clostridia bacterium]|nr:hypothetical protein [Clostridia bacterium]